MMFLSREIDIKLCQNYTKTYICKIFVRITYSSNGSAVLLSRPSISFTYTFWYNFDTVLCQFLETVTSNRFLICIRQFLRFSGLIFYSLSFFLYSPFNIDSKAQLCWGTHLIFERVR